MLEILELIIASPLGAAAGAALQDSLYAAIVISDCDECGFNDLGRLLFAGLMLAVATGLTFLLLRHRAPKNRALTLIRIRDRED